MIETIDIIDKQVEAQELDQLIKLHANQAWCHLLESARCLKKMRDTKLYSELGYNTFEEYTVNSLKIKERQAYTYISTLEKVGEEFLQSNANLGITKLALISNIPLTDRQDVIDNNDIAGMSVKDVKKLVAENDAKGEQINMLNDEIEDKVRENDELNQNNSELLEKISGLEKELKKEREKPTEVAVKEPDPAEIEKIKAEAQKNVDKLIKSNTKKLEEAHKKALVDAEEKFKAEKEKELAEYKQKLGELDSEKATALKKTEDLEKQLSVSASPETIKLQYYFESLQDNLNKMRESIKSIRRDNPQIADKFKAALLEFTEIMKSNIEQV